MEISMQGFNTTQRFDKETAYKMIADAGFTAIDWAIDTEDVWGRTLVKKGVVPTDCLYAGPIENLIDYYKDEIELIKKYNLKITQAHAPFPAYIKGNPEFTDFCVEVYKKSLKLCQYADCPRLVIHGISKSPIDDTVSYEDIFDLNMKMYTALIPTALETGVMILLENLFVTIDGKRYAGTCANPAEAVKYIDSLNEIAGKEVFGLCFDTGHCNLLHQQMEEYILTVGKRIKALHIHDNDFNSDQHLAPYTGTIRWNEFYNSLKAVGYDGDLSFETFKQTTADRVEDEMVMPWLKLMYECGVTFKNKIEG